MSTEESHKGSGMGMEDHPLELKTDCRKIVALGQGTYGDEHVLSAACCMNGLNGTMHSLAKAICIAFVLTFFSAFDVPVFWPILLFYWLVLFISTMKRQIMHMIKYRYVPFTFGKQRYTGKKVASSDDAKAARP